MNSIFGKFIEVFLFLSFILQYLIIQLFIFWWYIIQFRLDFMVRRRSCMIFSRIFFVICHMSQLLIVCIEDGLFNFLVIIGFLVIFHRNPLNFTKISFNFASFGSAETKSKRHDLYQANVLSMSHHTHHIIILLGSFSIHLIRTYAIQL